VLERHRAVLGDGGRILVRLLGQRAAGRAVDDAPLDRDLAQALEQLDRGQEVVLVVEQRLGDRVLIAVERGQVVDLVIGRVELAEDRVVRDRTLQEARSAESRLSTTVTVAASSLSARRTRLEPTNPAPPTTSRRLPPSSGRPSVTRAPRGA
jgi:hypothetical protein